jgi:hypothetical protein
MKNVRGPFHMGNANLPVSVNLEDIVFFVYPQDDGTLLLSIEKYDDKKHGRSSSESGCKGNEDPRCQNERKARSQL